MKVTPQPGREKECPLMVILTGEEEDQENICSRLGPQGREAFLLFISGFDWNRDLSPWPAPAVFKGGAAFGGGADAFLREITGRILPNVQKSYALKPAWCGIAGYSLAGLFALYCLYRSSVFSHAACASGSLWFDGFSDFALETSFCVCPRKVYFSLGSREGKTRSLRMASNMRITRDLEANFKGRGIHTVFELNPGNHFKDISGRLAKGIAWLLSD